ncbi:hypothetical protein CYMTET_21363 [Cymbomonas tetramitiformis]|uniref:Uncharacterized protein n=1 Tax=Cymbomonas tetramitiformis TaxID=36881 RepID=A0AAE0G2N7_9CHLO|nr:hypothetical protein CYMTET_21363 [Cymbomonas tetramitiformis]
MRAPRGAPEEVKGGTLSLCALHVALPRWSGGNQKPMRAPRGAPEEVKGNPEPMRAPRGAPKEVKGGTLSLCALHVALPRRSGGTLSLCALHVALPRRSAGTLSLCALHVARPRRSGGNPEPMRAPRGAPKEVRGNPEPMRAPRGAPEKGGTLSLCALHVALPRRSGGNPEPMRAPRGAPALSLCALHVALPRRSGGTLSLCALHVALPWRSGGDPEPMRAPRGAPEEVKGNPEPMRAPRGAPEEVRGNPEPMRAPRGAPEEVKGGTLSLCALHVALPRRQPVQSGGKRRPIGLHVQPVKPAAFSGRRQLLRRWDAGLRGFCFASVPTPEAGVLHTGFVQVWEEVREPFPAVTVAAEELAAQSDLPYVNSLQAAMQKLSEAMGVVEEARGANEHLPPRLPKADDVKKLSDYSSSQKRAQRVQALLSSDWLWPAGHVGAFRLPWLFSVTFNSIGPPLLWGSGKIRRRMWERKEVDNNEGGDQDEEEALVSCTGWKEKWIPLLSFALGRGVAGLTIRQSPGAEQVERLAMERAWEDAIEETIMRRRPGRVFMVAGRKGLGNATWAGEAGRMASRLSESMEDVRRKAENLRVGEGQGLGTAAAWSAEEQSLTRAGDGLGRGRGGQIDWGKQAGREQGGGSKRKFNGGKMVRAARGERWASFSGTA